MLRGFILPAKAVVRIHDQTRRALPGRRLGGNSFALRATLGGHSAMAYQKLTPPKTGDRISVNSDGSLNVPDKPIIPFIEGDGTGPDIWKASEPVFNTAVEKAYGGKRRITWFEVYAGEKALKMYGA